MEKTKAEKITEIKGLLKINHGKTFLRTYKDEIVEYKIENGNLYCWSELFFQWEKDNLAIWSEDQLQILIKTLEGKSKWNLIILIKNTSIKLKNARKKSNVTTDQSTDIT